METKEMSTIDKIAVVNGHLARVMSLAADLRVEMDIIANSVCIDETGTMVVERKEYCDTCGDLDSIIFSIGKLTRALMAEAIFEDVEKRMCANYGKLTGAQKGKLTKC